MSRAVVTCQMRAGRCETIEAALTGAGGFGASGEAQIMCWGYRRFQSCFEVHLVTCRASFGGVAYN
jgi:hypothetical protein